MLSVFGDESHDTMKSKVFAVAALVGDAGRWQYLRSKWKERTGGRIFHAADCESARGDYEGESDSDLSELHRDLTKILVDSEVFGYGFAIDVKGCTKAFPETAKKHPNMLYHDCFLRTILSMIEFGSQFSPPENLEFTFDGRCESDYNARLVFDSVAKSQPMISEKVSFSTRRDSGIQAADLFARELMKRADGFIYDPGVKERPAWVSLKNSGRVNGELLLSGYFESSVKWADQFLKPMGIGRSEYMLWLKSKNRQDNLSNRFEFCDSTGKIWDYIEVREGDTVDL